MLPSILIFLQLHTKSYRPLTLGSLRHNRDLLNGILSAVRIT